MLRVLHIVPSLDVNAGMMSVVMNYYRHIDRSKIQFDFLYLFDEPNNHFEEIKALGGRAYKIGAPSFSPTFVNRINDFFSNHEGEYGVLHCHPIWTPVLFAKAAKNHGVKHVIAHSHSVRYSEKALSAMRNRALLPIIKMFVTDYMACSEDAAELFRLPDKTVVSIINNAIDTESYLYNETARSKIREELGIGADVLTMGHVGRFSVEKNHAFLLEVFEKLLLEMPEARLLLVGDGAKKTEIENEAAKRGFADKIVFTGVRQDINKLLSAMDIFLLPSLFEGVPVVALEAQAAGLSCIISDTVTKKIDLTGCKYVSIDSGAEPWIVAVKEYTNDTDNRIAANKLLSESDYNINRAAQHLEKLYLSMND